VHPPGHDQLLDRLGRAQAGGEEGVVIDEIAPRAELRQHGILGEGDRRVDIAVDVGQPEGSGLAVDLGRKMFIRLSSVISLRLPARRRARA
jgi:hypothetical protein